MPNEEAKNEVYEEKLKGTQHMISSKKLDFFITQEQKQGIMGHWALPEQNLGRGFFFTGNNIIGL